MYLSSLYLKNFRIYDEGFFEFSPRINLIRGPNAQGKTTILEAIHLLITGRSFRTNQIQELIRHGADHFFVEARFVKHGVEQTLKFACGGREKKIYYNNTQCRTYASLYGLMQGVAMTPDDVALVKGGPALRRQFLDTHLAQVDPLYVHHLTRYNRALKQRNMLLKKRSEETIATWESEMGKAAAYLIQQRRAACKALQIEANRIHNQLSDTKETLQVHYKTTAPEESIEAYYHAQWKKLRSREMQIGITLYGPHRDDLTVMISDKEVRHYGSEGQQRSCIASLSLAGWEQLKQRSQVGPLMLVDDVGISLDLNRRKQLFAHLSSLQQVFLTATESIDVPFEGIEIPL